MTIDFKTIAEHSSEAITVLDHDWRYLYSNYRAELLMRQSKVDFNRHSHWQIFPELLNTPAETHLRRAMSSRVTVKFEQFIPRLYTWHSVRAVPVDCGLVLYTTDITDRVRAARDDAVRAEVRKLFEDVPVAIGITRGKEHRIEMMNGLARKMIGGRDIEGLTARAAFPELEGQGYFELLDNVYSSGKRFDARSMPVRYAAGTDGELLEFFFDIVYQPLFETNGDVSGILSMRRDVTQRKREKERHQKIAAERDAILMQLSEGVIVTDVEGRITFANEAAIRLYGVTKLEGIADGSVPRHSHLTESGDEYPADLFPLQRAVHNDEVISNARWRIRRPDGSAVLIEGNALPVYDKQGMKIAAVLVMRALDAT